MGLLRGSPSVPPSSCRSPASALRRDGPRPREMQHHCIMHGPGHTRTTPRSGPSGMHPHAFYKGNIVRSASKHSHALFFRKVENFQLLYSFPLVYYQFKAIMQSVWHLFTDGPLLVLVLVLLHPMVLGWQHCRVSTWDRCVSISMLPWPSVLMSCVAVAALYHKQFHHISGHHSYHKKLLEVFRDSITWLCHLKAYWKYIGIYSRGWVFLCLNYWKMLWLQDRVSNFCNQPNGFCLFLKPSKHFV